MMSTFTSEPQRPRAGQRRAPSPSGQAGAARRHGRADRRELQRLLEARDGPRAPAVRSRRRCAAGAGDCRSIRRRTGSITTGTCSCPVWRRDRSTDSVRPGPFDPASGHRFDRGEGAARSVRTRASSCPKGYDREAGAAERGQHRDGDEERRGRSVRLRLGRRPVPPHAVVADHRVRDARAWVHAAPELGRLRANPRHATPG